MNLIKESSRTYLKGIVIFIIGAALMIPTALVKDLIRERQHLKQQVQHEVADSWGKSQLVTGPILVLPFEKHRLNSDNESWYSDEMFVVMPDDVQMDINVKNHERKRSLYEVQLFEAACQATGQFTIPQEYLDYGEKGRLKWDEAYIAIGLADVTAITGKPTFKIDEKSYPIKTGTKVFNRLTSGLSVTHLNLDKTSQSFDFLLDMNFKGSEQLSFHPVGTSTVVNMQSDWHSPGFVGNFTTAKHDIRDDGFTAKWEVNEFNRNFPNYWHSDLYNFKDQWFGVNLVQPVDDYQKNMRSAKYALLIISLSFLLFFFFEMLSDAKMHPIQYGLIGLSLVVFYSLLLSITEQFGFDIAYWISALATIFLIVIYCAYIFKSRKQLMFLFFILFGLYGYIYTILQLEDFALLVGSVGLFFILASIMIITRKVNFYELSKPLEKV